MKLTKQEEVELEILTNYKLSRTRFMMQEEQDRYHYLMKKKFEEMAVPFEFAQIRASR